MTAMASDFKCVGVVSLTRSVIKTRPCVAPHAGDALLQLLGGLCFRDLKAPVGRVSKRDTWRLDQRRPDTDATLLRRRGDGPVTCLVEGVRVRPE